MVVEFCVLKVWKVDEEDGEEKHQVGVKYCGSAPLFQLDCDWRT